MARSRGCECYRLRRGPCRGRTSQNERHNHDAKAWKILEEKEMGQTRSRATRMQRKVCFLRAWCPCGFAQDRPGAIRFCVTTVGSIKAYASPPARRTCCQRCGDRPPHGAIKDEMMGSRPQRGCGKSHATGISAPQNHSLSGLAYPGLDSAARVLAGYGDDSPACHVGQPHSLSHFERAGHCPTCRKRRCMGQVVQAWRVTPTVCSTQIERQYFSV
jgi:hypothetical protein